MVCLHYKREMRCCIAWNMYKSNNRLVLEGPVLIRRLKSVFLCCGVCVSVGFLTSDVLLNTGRTTLLTLKFTL